MYCVYKIDGICEYCREIENKIKLDKWIKDNPNIQLSWEGSRSDLAKIKKDAGYYQWSSTKKPTLYVESDCHGDSFELCEEHLDYKVNEFKAWIKDHK